MPRRSPEQSLRMYGATIPFAQRRCRAINPMWPLSLPSAMPLEGIGAGEQGCWGAHAEGYLLPADLDEVVQRAIWRYNLAPRRAEVARHHISQGRPWQMRVASHSAKSAFLTGKIDKIGHVVILPGNTVWVGEYSYAT
jgi:hypothetical protein